ncbi:MAG TPA: BMP family ABC transporter substrate-binding protein [Acidimicrobiales bacterium]
MRKQKRWLLPLAVLASFALLAAACGDDDDTATGGDGDGSDLQVGLVYDIGGRGDKSFNDSAAQGLDRAVQELGIPEPQELEPDEGGQNRQELLQNLAEAGADLIFGVGFLFADSMAEVAGANPDTNFAIIDDATVQLDNVANLTFAEEEGSFLVGAAAALKSQTGKIGFIGGVQTELIAKFEAGYVAGARAVNPNIEIDIKYITQPPDFSGFNAPERAKEIARSQYQAGADVIYHAAGGSGLGLFQAAQEASAGGAKKWAIGVDSDQYESVDDPQLQQFILTSMLKKVDVAVFDTIQAAVNGEFSAGNQVFDLASGGVDYSRSGGFVDDIADQLDEFKQQIIDGEIEVPSSPTAS